MGLEDYDVAAVMLPHHGAGWRREHYSLVVPLVVPFFKLLPNALLLKLG